MRVLLILTGLAAIAFGAYSALERSFDELLSAGIWFAGGIVLHDFVFAPLCLAVWFIVLRRLPVWVTVAGVVTTVLVVIAIPVLPREGTLPNATVLDRNYAAGLAGAIAVVWVLRPLPARLTRGVGGTAFSLLTLVRRACRRRSPGALGRTTGTSPARLNAR